MSLQLLLQAYLLGWAVAAPIGPVNIEIIRRSLRHGLLAGFLVGVGATLIDMSYMLLTSFGLARFFETRGVLLVCFVAGGGLMAFLATMALRDAVRCWRGAMPAVDAPEEGGPARPDGRILRRSLLVGLLMTAANPMTIGFWATLPSLFFHGRIPGAGAILAATAFVWLGTISWVGSLMGILVVARRLVGPRLFAVASGLGGLAMGWFALRFWWLAWHLERVAGGGG